ncbi:MAG: metal-dependent hydrolase [Bacilli bacterium]|nr:metal-dependent hydrolase [Bacilli bacterium]
MEKKTHVACANLVSLSLLQPKTVPELLITVGTSTIGALLPDVDLKDSTSDKIFDRLMTSLITIIIMSIIINYFFNINIYNKIKEYNNIYNYIICITIFIIMSYLGSKTSHRSFTHSFLGLFIYSIILSYSFSNKIVITYFISHLSHIILDLLNMKGIALFYPLKFRLSLKLCEVKGIVNKILFITSSLLNIIVLILISIK